MSTISPKVLKQFEKEIAKEGEAEEGRIKDAMKELAASQKEQERARKVSVDQKFIPSHKTHNTLGRSQGRW